MGRARIVGAGHAVPAPIGQRVLWETFGADCYPGNALARRIWEASGIDRRHLVLDPRVEPDALRWGIGERMQRYVTAGVALGRAAIEQALASAGVAPGEIGLLTVVSSTGYAIPGLDILLARELGMSAEVERLLIGPMGCAAALPGLSTSADYVVRNGRPAVVLCAEFNSVHAALPTAATRPGRHTREDVDQIVISALLGDAAAAVVLAPTALPSSGAALPGLDVEDFIVRTDADSTRLVTVAVSDHG